MEENYPETIAELRKGIKERDWDIQKAATFGKQLLDDNQKLNEKLHQILSENEAFKQEKYSLQLDLETQVQTVNTQSSELEIRNEQYDNIKRTLELLQKESKTQKQQINSLKHEKEDLEKSLQDADHEKNELKKKNAFQRQQIESLQQKAEVSLNISLPENLNEENDINYYKLQNKQLQEALSEIQFELRTAKLEENRLLNLVKELEEEVQDRDTEIKSFSTERKKSREIAAELQCEIETLKLEQLDVNRRGNSVFGELDDRRKLVEKEYKLLVNRYDNMLVNFHNNQRELSNCKNQMAVLLSMTSRSYQNTYIEKLEDNLMEKKQEIENLSAQLRKLVRFQNQKPSCLEQMSKGGDEYDYLKVLYEHSEKKIKTLENDIVTLHMKNINDNNALTGTQQHLYLIQEDLDAVKIENMKLKQKLEELTAKPDDPGPPKSKTRIEILPGYNVSSEMVKKAGLFKKKTCDEGIIPAELLLVDGVFREIKPKRRSNKSILQSFNKIYRDEEPSSEQESDEEITDIKYLKDISEERKHEENNVRPSYAKYNLSNKKNRNDSNCAHQ